MRWPALLKPDQGGSGARIQLVDSLDQVDAANTAMNSDPGYIEMIDQGGALFLPGSGYGRLSQRLA